MWKPWKASPPPAEPTSTWEVPLNMKLSQAPVQDEPLDLSMKPKSSTSGQGQSVKRPRSPSPVPPPTQNSPEVAAAAVNEESQAAGASGDGNFKKKMRRGDEEEEEGEAEKKDDDGIWVPIKTRPIHVEIESEPENEDLIMEQLKAGPSFSEKPQQLLQIVTEKPPEQEPEKSAVSLPMKKKKHPDLVMAEAYLAKYPESGTQQQAPATASTSTSTATAAATETEIPQAGPAPKKRKGKKFPEPFLLPTPKTPPNSPVVIVTTGINNPLFAQPQPILTSMIETTIPQKRRVFRRRRRRTEFASSSTSTSTVSTAASSPTPSTSTTTSTATAESPAPKKVRFSDDIASAADGSDTRSAVESNTSSEDESGAGKKQKGYKPKPTITIGGDADAAGGDKVDGSEGGSGGSDKAASGSGNVAGAVDEHFQKSLGPLYQQQFKVEGGSGGSVIAASGSRPGYVAGTVEEHFQKSLGPLYQQFFNKNDGNMKATAATATAPAPITGSSGSGIGMGSGGSLIAPKVGYQIGIATPCKLVPVHQYQHQTGFQGIGIGSCSQVTPTSAHFGFQGSTSTIVQSQSQVANLAGPGQGIDVAATAAFYFYYGQAVAGSSFMKGNPVGMGMPNPSAFSFNK